MEDLPEFELDLTEIGTIGFSLTEPGGEAVEGDALLIDLEEATRIAKDRKQPWPRLLPDTAIVSRWKQNARQKVLIGYSLHAHPMVVVYHVSKSPQPMAEIERYWSEVFEETGYCEGRDNIHRVHFRPLAYWEPGLGVVALWPKGPPSEDAKYRILDAGNLVGYYSWPCSEEELALEQREASDSVAVPLSSSGILELGGRRYAYLNRYFVPDEFMF